MTEAGELEMVLISFPVSVIKDPDRSNSREEGLCSAHRSRGQSIIARKSKEWDLIRKQRDGCKLTSALSAFAIFHSLVSPSQGTVMPTWR